jgi:hypothetical protein
MLKSKALRGGKILYFLYYYLLLLLIIYIIKIIIGANLTSDIRVHCMRLIKGISVMESIVFFYPRLIPVHNISDQVRYHYKFLLEAKSTISINFIL